jgi:hypothetical protein
VIATHFLTKKYVEKTSDTLSRGHPKATVVLPGPPTVAVLTAARRLQRRGHTVEILPTHPGRACPQSITGGQDVIVIKRVTTLLRSAPSWALLRWERRRDSSREDMRGLG